MMNKEELLEKIDEEYTKVNNLNFRMNEEHRGVDNYHTQQGYLLALDWIQQIIESLEE